MENYESVIKLASAVILLAAYLIVVIVNILQYKKLRKELKEVKVIVKDTNEMREALKKPLEGNWSIFGEFSKYKSRDVRHYSSGHATFSWNLRNSRYDVLYMYSVRKENSVEDVVTCFCSGHISTDKDGNISEKNLKLNMKIESRTANADYGSEISKSFIMSSEKLDSRVMPINNLTFNLKNSETVGKILFSK